ERIIVRRGLDVVATEELWRPDRQHLRRFRVVWSGTKKPGTARDQAMDWSGQLSVSDGSVKLAGAVGAGSGPEIAAQGSANAIRWRSVTAGDVTGVEFEADPGVQLRFDSPAIAFEVRLTEAIDELREVSSAGGMGYVRIKRAPDPSGPRDARSEERREGMDSRRPVAH